ncbi:ATP-binding cassette domain-containing protein [Candidatus Berkiella aquae]|uniref:ABC transporter ATP-binding protein n=1 Tax=Candidatus Berkiella aquae TaxID=295108 RepID=A0A0Q9Z1J9_9GAMM|nr:ABC transporter ATP-binding protein [Candidatus Berkiella aquae]MCS5712444.1 ABC transporter ATP-binding protein [Candidatus Berkiella aquae]
MCSDETVIQVDDIGKCFEIYKQPQDRLKQFIYPKIQNALKKPLRNYYEPFWALQHISFEVKKGQSVGILGQNGSGKSTLLQLINGILTPTYGHIRVQGNIGSLIELGSGFNPDFTGRENVHLNGSLLGLSNQAIEQKFDQIAAFADIGEHLERAVKTYSSGMMLRLAFAVQMAVEPDILIIDEALAVGDAKFQLKCFKRLDELKEKGTTILFVSHSTEMVRSFCDVGLVLNYGQLILQSDAKAATSQYLSLLFPDKYSITSETEQSDANSTHFIKTVIQNPKLTQHTIYLEPEKMNCYTFGIGGAQINYLKISGLHEGNVIPQGQEIKIRCQFSWEIAVLQQQLLEGIREKNITVGISLADKKGSYIYGCNGFDIGLQIDCFKDTCCTVEFSIKTPILAEGDYFLTAAIAFGNLSHHVQLKWYDCFMLLKILKSQRNVFGTIAIDYKMILLNQNGIENEQTTAIDLQ